MDTLFTNIRETKNMEMEQQEFRRELGVWSCSALVAGSMIGTGIFLFVDPVAKSLSDPMHIVLAWVVGAIIAFCGSLCLAELASSYPKTGGIYVYLHQAFGPLVAFLYTWTKFLIMRVGRQLHTIYEKNLKCDGNPRKK